MTGTFILSDGGTTASAFDTGASIYTGFPAESVTNGWTLIVTLIPRDDASAYFTLGVTETINKGHFSNLVTNDVVRLTYYTAATNSKTTGAFSWGIYDEGVKLNDGTSVRTGQENVLPTDEIQLTITCYPALGMIEGVAYNLTGGYELSSLRTAVNTPGLTNMLYAGMGWLYLSGTNTASPALVTSFTVEPAADHTVARALSLPLEYPIGFEAFSFDKISGTNDPLFSEYLSLHQPIPILHSPRKSVYDAVRAAYPEKILIVQDAFGGIGMFPEDLTNAYPGHLLMKAGTRLTANCTSTDTVLHVQDYSLLFKNQAAVDAVTNLISSYLLLYALDDTGRPDWSRAEHIKIKTINTAAGTITVDRAQLGSTALNLQSNKAVVAYHMMFWSNQWQLNFSLECPRGGPFNQTAAEWYALRKKQRVWQTKADGIETDVSRWQWGSPTAGPMDCDNNLVADYGYIGGINSFGLGAQVYLKTLRDLLGSNKIIQMDGNDALNGQRSWQYVNGVQMESFPYANSFDRFSESFLHLRRWVNQVESSPAFSYPFTKTPTTLFGNCYDTDGSTVDWRFRVGFAAALLTGMPHPFASITDINFDPTDPDAAPNLVEDKDFYRWDEYDGGSLGNWTWLGRPLGDAVQILDQVSGSNLLTAASWQWKTETNFSAVCVVSNGEYTADITAIPSNTPQWVAANYPGSQVPQALWFGVRLETAGGIPALVTNREYTLEFEAKGNESWVVNGQSFDRVPRSLMIHGIANYGYQKPASLFLSTNWASYRFSMIADRNAPPPLTFGFSEQVGNATIRNIKLYSGGAERWTREFEHGRVYLNMTKTPWTVNVGTGVVQRLSGTQIPELNNGAVVNGTLTIPAWDAVFLRTWTLDAWRIANFTMDQLMNSAVSGDAADPDSDGFSNLQEYIAGTDPQNPQSQFRSSLRPAAAGNVLDWSSVSGRVYEVYWTTNLLSTFLPLQTNIAWPQSSYTSPVPGDAGSGFYKLHVRRR